MPPINNKNHTQFKNKLLKTSYPIVDYKPGTYPYHTGIDERTVADLKELEDFRSIALIERELAEKTKQIEALQWSLRREQKKTGFKDFSANPRQYLYDYGAHVEEYFKNPYLQALPGPLNLGTLDDWVNPLNITASAVAGIVKAPLQAKQISDYNSELKSLRGDISKSQEVLEPLIPYGSAALNVAMSLPALRALRGPAKRLVKPFLTPVKRAVKPISSALKPTIRPISTALDPFRRNTLTKKGF